MKRLALLIPLVCASCPGPRDLDGLACDSSAACSDGYICSEGVCLDAGVCGDGAVNIGEQCDSFALAGAACPFGQPGAVRCTPSCELDFSGCELRCGDGQRHPTEECDDGNDVGRDLCSPACTLTVTPALETEPNDDGAVTLEEDDFLATAATGPFTVDTLIAGAVANGDQDAYAVFALETTTLTVSLHAGVAMGTCGNYTGVRMREEGGAVLYDLPRTSGSGCPLQTFEIEGGRTVYIEVHIGDRSEGYLLGLDFTP